MHLELNGDPPGSGSVRAIAAPGRRAAHLSDTLLRAGLAAIGEPREMIYVSKAWSGTIGQAAVNRRVVRRTPLAGKRLQSMA